MNYERLAYFRYVLWHMDKMIIRLFHMIGLIFLKKNLAAVESLQRANETVQKYLADVYVRMEVRILTCRIKLCEWIEFTCFDKVYGDFVERKRQSLLKDINRINSQYMEALRDSWGTGLPNIEFPAEKQMELSVLETYYAYLKDDEVYRQKAFKLFLEKKMEAMKENGVDYSRIQNYLENKSRNANYEDYMACISMPIDIRLARLWVEFFKSGEGYKDVIPKERPDVAYFSINADIPEFIFKKPYVQEYSEYEFCSRFQNEWDITHYNPRDDDDRDYDPVRYEDYAEELRGRPQNAYCFYLGAVNRFKQIQQNLQNTDNGSKMEK